VRNIGKLVPVIAVLLVSVLPTCAQNTGPGTTLYGSYTRGSIDVVNNQNLNARTEYTIASIAGRGLNFTYSESNDSQIWAPVTIGTTTSWTPVSDWGWRTLRPTGQMSYKTIYLGTCRFTQQPMYHYYNYVYTDPQGAQHTFSQLNYQWIQSGSACYITGTLSAYADDGSQLYATVNGQTNGAPKL
jgi:hypothetical protein